uniref:Uncharacterized protein n=1 Tax=Rhodnius prolixus TaxID=13249 RepID=T1I948_RHOPR
MVTIKLMCSLKTTILHALENRKLTRLFVAINDTKISSKLLKTIIFHNGNIIGKSLIVPKVPFYQGDYIKSNFPVKKGENYLEKTELKHLITGFTVDTLDAFLFFAEGLAEDISAEVWNIVFSLQTSQGFVLYNSDLSFGQRLYEDFVSIGGIYVITLGVPWHRLFADPKIFLEGYIPAPAWRALLALKNLLMSSSMQEAVQMNWFPAYNELICLDMEFGVPMYKNY